MIDKIYILTYGRADKQITFKNLPKKYQEKVFFVLRPEEVNLFREYNKIILEVRGKKHDAVISKLPFYKKSYVK